MTSTEEKRYGIAFFDVETTIPTRRGQGRAILEFGSILVCPRRLVELDSYSTLVRPSHLSFMTNMSRRCNGITRDAVSSAPSFAEIADKVYDILHGRIWAGHNILRFDCARIKEAFEEIGKPVPEPKGCIDTYTLLTRRFGKRAGNMKMASLASYFDLGQQIHRSLDDVRLNLEVLKHCAAVLLLESSLPDNPSSPSATRRHELQQAEIAMMTPSMEPRLESQTIASPMDQALGGRILDLVQRDTSVAEPFSMNAPTNEISGASLQRPFMEESSDTLSSTIAPQGCSGPSPFLAPDQVLTQSISASLVPTNHGYPRVKILHREIMLKLQLSHVKVRFSVGKKFLDQAGRPRLSIVVDAPPSVCQVLDACDSHTQSFIMWLGSTSDWRRANMATGNTLQSGCKYLLS